MAELRRDDLQRLYRTLRTIRRFEELAIELSNAGEIPGSIHLCLGQEAVAVGVCAALRPTDYVTSTHRGHGHLLAKGAEPRLMMAELMARTSGLNRGRGGSMHVADFGKGVLGANGIVGAGVPWAVGAAWAASRRGEDRVAVAFFGDGAINQGIVNESLELAVTWRAPVVFCCENNQYAVSMRVDAASAVPLTERASSFGMEVASVDGMDPVAVRAAAVTAVEAARASGRPSFLECRTYRFSGHFAAEQSLQLRSYRSDEEIAYWTARDPIVTFPERLLAAGTMTAEEKDAVDSEVEDVLADAIDFARESPSPAPEEALDFVYAQGQTDRFPHKGWTEP